MVTVSGRRVSSLPSVLVGDLEGGVAVLNAAHVVEPPLSCALIAAPLAAEESHNCIRLCGELDILAGLVGRLIELLTHEVGHFTDHRLVLIFVDPRPGPRHLLIHPDKVALFWVAGYVTEIFSKVVVTRRTCIPQQTFWKLKICFDVFELI